MNVTLEMRYADVVRKVVAYLPDADLHRMRASVEYAFGKHDGQVRKSGEPYIGHPIEVAHIAADMHLDMPSVCAAFLHDTVEDTDATLEDIEELFGEDVRLLVDGLTKISKLKFRSKEEAQAENIRKLIISMGRDVRVVLVKLADRLHNLRTLEHMAETKQRRIAQETLDIYAPLANRLGINWMKSELEDTSFRYTNRDAYYGLAKRIHATKAQRERYISDTSALIRSLVQQQGVDADIKGRPKHFYSIYRKMEADSLDLDEIFDVTAFRVVVDRVDQCYAVLGVMHAEWKPIAGRFKDYIAVPKPNGYQSLHTTVLGPNAQRIEIQIRTNSMHRVAEFGVAAHWAYKEGKSVLKPENNYSNWIQDVVSAQAEVDDSIDFMDTIQRDLLADEVIVFTPDGDTFSFPRGATPLDFAYAVHSEVGHRAVHARVNNRGVSLRHELKTGDQIEITTRNDQHPREEWLDFVRSGKARAKIRQYIRGEKRDRARDLGKNLITAELRRFGLKYEKVLKNGDLQAAAEILKSQTVDMLLINVGYQKIRAETVVDKIKPPDLTAARDLRPTGSFQKLGEHLRRVIGRPVERGVRLAGVDGEVLVHYARCCSPVPGDEIVGYVTRGRGVVVHTAECRRVSNLEPERQTEVEWGALQDGDSERRTTVRVVCKDEPGLLSQMTNTISSKGVNITQAHCRTREDGLATNIFEVSVSHASQLNDATRALNKLEGVVSVERVKG